MNVCNHIRVCVKMAFMSLRTGNALHNDYSVADASAVVVATLTSKWSAL